MKNYYLRFTKVSGAGNDFILFDTLNHVVPMLGQETIQRLCTRGLGIGADGILILSPSRNADFKVNYFNADGSSGMLCANGARCAVIYAKKFFDLKDKSVTIECCGEKYSSEILDHNLVRFSFGQPIEVKDSTILLGNNELEIFISNTGAPHVVFEFSEVKKLITNESEQSFDLFDMFNFGKTIRNHPAFHPEGINVNVVKIKKNNKIKIRSYERGVENETLACGTGIVAAALMLANKKGLKSPIEIWSKSNRKFIVEFNEDNGKFVDVKLTGEAEIIYYGEILHDDYSLK